MSISETFREWLLQPALDALTKLQTEVIKMATTQDQYDALLTQLGQVVTNEDSVIATALTGISAAIAKLAAAVPPTNVDLTNEATAAQSMIADIQAQTASLSTAVSNLGTAVTPPPAA